MNLKQRFCENAPAEQFDAAFRFKALYGLALWALRFAPLVGLDREITGAFRRRMLESCSPLHNGLTLDITGTGRLYKSEGNLVSLVRAEFVKAHFEVRIAAASTIGAAWALSRYGRDNSCIIEHQELFRAVSALPVESLRISPQDLQVLRELGLGRIAELLKLPPADLNTRFGPLPVRRLEEMLGHRQEVFAAVRRPESFVSRRVFDTPLLQHEAVKTALLGAFDEVLGRLARRGKKAGLFRIDFDLHSETLGRFRRSREIVLHFAVRNFSGIAPAIDGALESLNISGALLSFEIRAAGLERALGAQEAFLESSQTASVAAGSADLINNLVLKLGVSRVKKASFQNSHVPEKSFAWRALDSESPTQTSAAAILDRPASFFDPPQPVEALSLLPDYPPSRIKWNGEELKIVEAGGPEKICGEWWNQGAGECRHRHYYKIQDHTGRYLWIFRDEEMCWFVQGVYA